MSFKRGDKVVDCYDDKKTGVVAWVSMTGDVAVEWDDGTSTTESRYDVSGCEGVL